MKIGAALALLGALTTAATACNHSFIYRADNLPEVQGGSLVYREAPDEDADRYHIEQVTVLRRGTMYFHPANHGELLQLGRRLPPPGVEAVHFDVSTSSVVWTDYALIGAGIGTAVGVLLAWTIPIEGEARLPMAALLGLSAGLEGMGIGGLIGALATTGTTDLRADGPATCRNPAPATSP